MRNLVGCVCPGSFGRKVSAAGICFEGVGLDGVELGVYSIFLGSTLRGRDLTP